jgi:LysM repeat protein
VVEHERERRVWAARLIAPLAFFAAATLLVVLIQAGLSGGTETTTSSTPTVSAPSTSGPATTGKKKKRFYHVHGGDTLESIAAKFDTTVDDLLQLNPNVDPLALSPGQKIRVA